MTISNCGPGVRSVNDLIRKMGKYMMLIYTVASYVTHSGYLSTSIYSLTLYLFVALGLANLYVNNNLTVQNRQVIWYGIFCAVSLLWVGVLTIYEPGAEWFSTFYQMIVGLLLCVSFSQFLEDREDINRLAYAYVLGAVTLMLLLAAEGRLEEDERLGTTAMGNANTFATAYMMSVIMGLWLVFNTDSKGKKLLLWAAIVCIFYGLLLSGGRKFILIPFLVLYIILLMRKDKRGRHHIFAYTAVIAALVLGVFWLMMENEFLYDIVGYRMEYLLNMITGEGDIGASNEMRQQLMALAYERGFESPVWGHGIDAFKNLGYDELRFYAYSHNNWAEIWYNYGLIGMFVYYRFYVSTVHSFWKFRRTSPDMTNFAVACMISIFVFEYGAVSYYMYPIQILFCIISVMYGIAAREGKAENGKG